MPRRRFATATASAFAHEHLGLDDVDPRTLPPHVLRGPAWDDTRRAQMEQRTGAWIYRVRTRLHYTNALLRRLSARRNHGVPLFEEATIWRLQALREQRPGEEPKRRTLDLFVLGFLADVMGDDIRDVVSEIVTGQRVGARSGDLDRLHTTAAALSGPQRAQLADFAEWLRDHGTSPRLAGIPVHDPAAWRRLMDEETTTARAERQIGAMETLEELDAIRAAHDTRRVVGGTPTASNAREG